MNVTEVKPNPSISIELSYEEARALRDFVGAVLTPPDVVKDLHHHLSAIYPSRLHSLGETGQWYKKERK